MKGEVTYKGFSSTIYCIINYTILSINRCVNRGDINGNVKLE